MKSKQKMNPNFAKISDPTNLAIINNNQFRENIYTTHGNKNQEEKCE